MVKHKDSVKYDAEPLGVVTLPKGWSAKRNSDGAYKVSGLCPTCLGPAYGPELPQFDPDESLLPDLPPLSDAREILATCHCGRKHGKDGATSCGRTWLVEISTDSDR